MNNENHNSRKFISIIDSGTSLIYKIKYGDNEEEIEVFKDLAGGNEEIDFEIKEKIALRNRDLNPKSTYVFNVHGGLGDVLMSLQCIKSFHLLAMNKGFLPDFVLIVSQKNYTFLKKYLEVLKIFTSILTIEELQHTNPTFNYKPQILNAGPNPYKPEALAIGSYQDTLWAIWGLEGRFHISPISPSEKEYFTESELEFDLFLNNNFPDRKSESVLIFPLGYGLMNQWKVWPEENWITLIDSLQEFNEVDFYIVTDKPDLLPKLSNDKNIKLINHSIHSDFNFECLLGGVSKAVLTIAVDTGPAHIAPIVGKSAIVLFGPTNPLIYGHKSNKNIRLSPCYPCYFSTQTLLCKKNVCMSDIEVEDIKKIIEKCFNKN